MRVAVHNEFFGRYCAETELARRICIAGENLGWEVIEVGSSHAIENFNPDFVLVLHFGTPKVTGFPTYGCMWNPISFFKQWCGVYKSQRNILSYDGYLSSSEQVDIWLKGILYGTGKKYFICPDFYTSCHQISYKQPQIEDPSLVYIGTNWDGSRYQEIFERLDRENYMQIYGSPDAWKYLTFAYKGALPFDGNSVISTLNQAGIGLCLHKQDHINAAIPSMRIFEIVASGALAICAEHAFIRRAFGDSVFYIDPNLSPQEQVIQISEYVQWVRDNPQKAIDMSLRAHQIFTEKYSLENLLLKIVPYHQNIVAKKGFVKREDVVQIDSKVVELIVRIIDGNEKVVRRCFESIAGQTYGNIRVILVVGKSLLHLNNLITEYDNRLKFKVIKIEKSVFRSTQMISGLNVLDGDYFGILNDEDLMYPNHIYSLVNILNNSSEEVGVAYSGSVCNTGTGSKLNPNTENSQLAYFEPFNLNKLLSFDKFIASNSFLARTELIDKNMLEDPELNIVEELSLIINLSRKTKFSFSYDPTCKFQIQSSRQGNQIFSNQLISEDKISSLSADDLEDSLRNALNVIKSMESTKFWKLRQQWFKLKVALGLSKSIE
jgi:Glycosyl transferase family 2